MKKLLVVALLALSSVAGCAYSGVATMTDGTVVIARNDFFGRQIFACKANGSGALDCQSVGGP
jgi:hypothetical protein